MAVVVLVVVNCGVVVVNCGVVGGVGGGVELCCGSSGCEL